jgi:copper(I)-binding protein
VILSNRYVLPLRGLAVVVAAALTPVIAGCEAGTNAPTQQWHQPTPGASAVVNNTIRINNMFVLGASPDSSLAPGGSAGMFFALSNDGSPDKLIGIRAPGTAVSVQLPAGGAINLGTQQLVLLTGPAPEVVLRDLTRSLIGGQYIRVVLDFQQAGAVTLKVPVMPRSQYFTTFSPAPASPSASPSPSASGKKKRHPAASPTASPSPTG